MHEPFRVDDADIVLPTRTSAGWLFPLALTMGEAVADGTNPNRLENQALAASAFCTMKVIPFTTPSSWQFKKR